MDDIQAKLLELVKTYCVGEITEDMDLYERGLNSLNSIEFLVDIEDCFDLSFESDELRIQHLKTIKDFENFIVQKQEEASRGED